MGSLLMVFYLHSSKDTFVKLWDLDTYHCFQTVVGHKSEVLCFCMCGGPLPLRVCHVPCRCGHLNCLIRTSDW